MASKGVPPLLEAFFIYNKTERLDYGTKAALRLCNKRFKSLIDATVVEAEKFSRDLNLDLNALLNTEWHSLRILHIWETNPDQNRLTELPSALFVKFSRLETLKISYCMSLKALPKEIGDLSNLRSLELYYCDTLVALPSSLGKLTALEKIILSSCNNLTVEGLAPLQHLTGLTSLTLGFFLNYKLTKYPDFICNLIALKDLHLSSHSINTLPTALGNLTNLESLRICLFKLKELPESIGKLNALKGFEIDQCSNLTTLPESLDDLLWRKAHETEESKKMELVEFLGSSNLVLSPKMKQALDLLKQNGADIRLSWNMGY